MDASPRAISPLQERMIDDLRMRKLSEKTQNHYLRWVQRFAVYPGRAPDTATVEDLRRYQLHLLVLHTWGGRQKPLPADRCGVQPRGVQSAARRACDWFRHPSAERQNSGGIQGHS